MLKSFQPKVSIIIPVYNGGQYLSSAIESALNQTYKKLEVIVVNDGSQDGGKTEKAAMKFSTDILYFRKDNGGVASALNFGIKKATGDYISWLSHDDVYIRTKIETQISYLRREAEPDRVLFYSDFEYIDENAKRIEIYRVKNIEPNDFIYALFSGGILHGCSLLIPKACFANVGYFNEELWTTQDYELWFRLIKNGFIFKHLPKVLLKARIHSKQTQRQVPFIYQVEREDLFIWAIDYFKDADQRLSLEKISGELYKEGLIRAYTYVNRMISMKKRMRKMHFFPCIRIGN